MRDGRSGGQAKRPRGGEGMGQASAGPPLESVLWPSGHAPVGAAVVGFAVGFVVVGFAVVRAIHLRGID